MDKAISLDVYMVQVIGWVLIFLVTSLIGIIIWLARTVIKKVDDLALEQGHTTVKLTGMDVSLSSVNREISDIYKRLEDIPELSEKASVAHEMLSTVKQDIGVIKQEHSDFTKRLSKVEMQAAVNAEWIRMTEQNKPK